MELNASLSNKTDAYLYTQNFRVKKSCGDAKHTLSVVRQQKDSI